MISADRRRIPQRWAEDNGDTLAWDDAIFVFFEMIRDEKRLSSYHFNKTKLRKSNKISVSLVERVSELDIGRS
jgi:hypothetical protein